MNDAGAESGVTTAARVRRMYGESAPAPAPSVKPASIWRRPLRDTLFVLVAVMLFDFFIYAALGGTGYGLLMACWGLGFFVITPQRRMLALPLLLLLLALGLRNIWQASALTVVLPPVCLLAMVAVQRAEITHWLEAMFSGLLALPSGIVEIWLHAGNVRRFAARPGAWRGLVGWLVPLFGALVVLLVFGSIFITANPVVARMWEWLSELLSLAEIFDKLLDILIPDFLRVVLWIFAALLTAGLLHPLDLLKSLHVSEEQKTRTAASPSELTGRTALFMLGTACLLFAGYILIDVNYLVIHAALPPGIGDSDYARGGTFWLTFALVLSTLFIGTATAQSELNSRWIRPVTRLAQAWVLLDLLMGLCVLGRVRFYIDLSGMTPLRIAGIVGTLMVMAGIATLGVKIARRRNLVWLIRRYTVVFLVGLSAFALLPRDSISSQYNVGRIMAGDNRPLMLLFRAPTPVESLTEYVALLEHPDPLVAQGMSAYLFERNSVLRKERDQLLDRDWREYQMARERALGALAEAAAAARLRHDERALVEMAKACNGYDDYRHNPADAWRTGQSSDLEWLDD